MTQEIPGEKWTRFFDDLSREKADWQTTVEVINNETGVQVLTDGLPLIGLTTEEADGRTSLAILVGDSATNQSHNIVNPQRVYFRQEVDKSKALLEIEDESGTKTLVYLTEPRQVLVVYPETHMVAT